MVARWFTPTTISESRLHFEWVCWQTYRLLWIHGSHLQGFLLNFFSLTQSKDLYELQLCFQSIGSFFWQVLHIIHAHNHSMDDSDAKALFLFLYHSKMRNLESKFWTLSRNLLSLVFSTIAFLVPCEGLTCFCEFAVSFYLG